MKKIVFATALALTLSLCTQNAQAQAWDKSTKVLSIGLGGSDFAHIYPNTFGGVGWNAPLTGQFNFQGEFGIHDYVGLGFTTGIGGRAGYYWGLYGGYGNAGEVTVPVGFVANFHFYQLIADKTGKDIHSDKLDIYAGANIGSGIAAQFFGNGVYQVVPIAFGGIHAGVRYYFTETFGVNGEIGTPYGKGFVNGGIVFKLK